MNEMIASTRLASSIGKRAPISMFSHLTLLASTPALLAKEGTTALLEACGIAPGEAPTAEQVAFRIAPRLNAAGRLDTADLALAVFEERNPARGAEIARELDIEPKDVNAVRAEYHEQLSAVQALRRAGA